MLLLVFLFFYMDFQGHFKDELEPESNTQPASIFN